jgi:hypothetical protein
MTREKVRAVAILAGISVALTTLVIGYGPGLQEAQAQENRERLVSFQSFNYPKTYLRHRDGLGFATEIRSELDRKDASWYLCPGLAGDGTVSFRSVNYPTQYLRHQDGRVKLNDFEDTDLFRSDASFKRVNGLARGGWESFESVNYPDCFLRHKNGELWVEKNDGSELFARDATFRGDRPFFNADFHGAK